MGCPCTQMWQWKLGGIFWLQRVPHEQETPEQVLQHLAMKISQNSIHSGETGGEWKHRCPLKSPTHRFSHSQMLKLVSSRGTAAWGDVRDTQVKTEFCSFKVKTGEKATTVPVLNTPPSSQRADTILTLLSPHSTS